MIEIHAPDAMANQPAAPASIDAYLAQQPEAVRLRLQRIRAIVHDEAPAAVETISYRMPAFVLQGPLVYFAAFKRHIGVYPPVQGDAALLLALAPYRGEKGNLSFPLAEDLPDPLIREVVRQRVRENASKAAKRRAK